MTTHLLQDKREEKQIEMANRIREALHCGLKVLEDAFVQLELEHTGGIWGGGEGGGERERERREGEERRWGRKVGGGDRGRGRERREKRGTLRCWMMFSCN